MTWVFYALASAVLYAIYFLLFHKTIHREHIWEYLTIMAICTVVFSFPLANNSSFHLSTGTWLWLYLISLLLTVFFVFIARSFKHLESSEVTPLMNLSLVLIVLLSVLVLNENVTLKNWIGIIFMIAGSYIIELGVKLTHIRKVVKKFKTKYIAYTFMALLAASVIVIFEKIALNPELLRVPIDPVAPTTLFFITRVGMALNFIVLLSCKRKSAQGLRHALKHRCLPIVATALFNIAANVIYYLALQDGPVSLVVTLSSLSTLIVVFIGGELFHEHKMPQKIIASLLMVIATYLIVL